MKDQYVGDIGDFGKYGLLRYLNGRSLRIGVNWYLTPRDGRTDGNHTEYLEDLRMRVCWPCPSTEGAAGPISSSYMRTATTNTEG